jgi:hypothetical protein
MQKNYFQGTKDSPAHISIGGVLRNDKGEIACHYFERFTHFGKEVNGIYILMRETIEPGETIEFCLMRGFQEEFGAEAKLVRFLGPIVCSAAKEDFYLEKTTLYFLCDLVSIDESKRLDGDPESESEIRWMNPEDLIPKMREQAARLGREDIDESSVLEKLIA